MVELIVGERGSRKTIKLIEKATARAEESKGHVVAIEKGKGLSFSLGTDIRLIDSEEYHISGPGEYYGFLAGLLAGNYDITDIYCDATFKIICGDDCKDMDMLEEFLGRVNELGTKHECTITFSVSASEDDLPESVKKMVKRAL